MAVTSGFFNSVDSDRPYNADQMSLYFEGLISQGVFENVGDRLQVTAGTGMSVNVGAGRAIVKSRWCKNDAALNLEISAADVQKNRIDAIAVRFDASARAVSIVVKEGTATTGTATPPSRATGADVYELFLAYVNVPKNASAITQAQITDLRASAMCGWVTGIIEQVDTSDLFEQWQAAYEAYYQQATAYFDNYMATKQAEFNEWFADLTSELRVDTTLHHYENTVTTADGATSVTIGIEDYDSTTDILAAYINGVMLVAGVDYTVSGTGESAAIELTRALVGTNSITFIVIKSVIGEGQPITFLKSVKSTGNSIVLTDIVPSYDWTLIANIKLGAQTLTTGSSMMIGCVSYDGQNIAGYYGPGYDSGNNQLGFYDGNIWGAGGYQITPNPKNLGTQETLIMRRGTGESIFGIQNVVITAPANYTAISDALAVFGGNIGGTSFPYTSTELTLYGLQFYDSTGVLLHNLVPARSNATQRNGLFDLATSKFYPSSDDFDELTAETISAPANT